MNIYLTNIAKIKKFGDFLPEDDDPSYHSNGNEDQRPIGKPPGKPGNFWLLLLVVAIVLFLIYKYDI